MPDLVYRMRIELPDSETQSIKQQLQEIESLKRQSASPSSSGSSSSSSNQLSENRRVTDSIRRQTSELNKARSAFRELQRVKGLDAQATKEAKIALEQKTNAVRKEVSSLMSGVSVSEMSEKQQVQLNNAVTASRNAFITADKSLENYNANLKLMGGQVGKNNKTFAGANQVVFSFSDLVQDSTQFSQGFAQGMRAIGNNVGFTAELFANLQNRVNQFNEQARKTGGDTTTVFKELKNTMTGVGAAVIGLNVAFLVGQVIADKMRRDMKELDEQAKATAEAIGEVGKSFSDFDTGATDPFGFRSRAVELEILKSQLGNFDAEAERSSKSMGALNDSFLSSVSPLRIITDLLPNATFRLGAWMGVISDDSYIATQSLEQLENQIKNTERAQRAYSDFLNDPSNVGIRNYVDSTAELEKILLDLRVGTNLTENSFYDLEASIRSQITALKDAGVETSTEIALLSRLMKLLDDTGRARQQAEQFTLETAEIRSRNSEILIRELGLIRERNVVSQAQAQRAVRDAEIQMQAQRDLDDVYYLSSRGIITQEQEKTRVQAIETAKRIQFAKSEAQEQEQILQQRRQALFALLNETSQLFGNLISLSQQRANQDEATARKEFENQKKLRMGQAVLSLASGIASAFSPYVPFISELRAGVVTASVGAQIAQIRRLTFDNPSSSGGSASSSASSGTSSFITRQGDATPPTFRPMNPQGQQMQPKFDIQVGFTNKELAIAVRDGDNKIRASQVGKTR